MATVVRAALVYILLLVVLRLTTRRIMRTATPLDMAIIFLFGGLATQPVLGDDRSFTNAFTAIFTIALIHIAVSLLKPRFPIFGDLSEGTAVVVFKDGELDHKRLLKLRVQEKDVLAEMRQNDVRDLSEVEQIIVEHNGGITVMKKRQD